MSDSWTKTALDIGTFGGSYAVRNADKAGDWLGGTDSTSGAMGIGQRQNKQYQVDRNAFVNQDSAVNQRDVENRRYETDRRVAKQMGTTNIAGNERAATSTADAAQINRSEDQQMREYQLNLARSLQEQAAGRGVGQELAESAYNKANDNSTKQLMGALAAQGDAVSPAVAQRMLMDSRNQVAMQNAQNLAADKLKAQLAAQEALGNLATGTREQDLGVNSEQAKMLQSNNQFNAAAMNEANQFNAAQTNKRNADQAQLEYQTKAANLEAYFKQMGMNDEMAKYYTDKQLALDEADRAAKVGAEQLVSDQNLGYNKIASGDYNDAAKRKADFWGDAMEAVAKGASASDERVKTNIKPATTSKYTQDEIDSVNDWDQRFKYFQNKKGLGGGIASLLLVANKPNNYDDIKNSITNKIPVASNKPEEKPENKDIFLQPIEQPESDYKPKFNFSYDKNSSIDNLDNQESDVKDIDLSQISDIGQKQNVNKFVISDERLKTGVSLEDTKSFTNRTFDSPDYTPSKSDSNQSSSYDGWGNTKNAWGFADELNKASKASNSLGDQTFTGSYEKQQSSKGYSPDLAPKVENDPWVKRASYVDSLIRDQSPNGQQLYRRPERAALLEKQFEGERSRYNEQIRSLQDALSRLQSELAAAKAKVPNDGVGFRSDVINANVNPSGYKSDVINANVTMTPEQANEQARKIALDYTHRVMSDKNQKKNVDNSKDLNSKVLDQFLDKIQAYTYDYKNPEMPGAGYGRQLGVMAQDLEKSEIGKSAVKEIDGVKTVDYGKLGGITLAGLSMVDKRQEEQDEKIANLEKAFSLALKKGK